MKRKLKVLIACEESQRVCIEFRRLGHEAYSCDVQEPSGGHPEWHILGDALQVLNPSMREDGITNIWFTTMNGDLHIIRKWDLIVAHPPCTYLSNAGACRLYPRKGQIDTERYAKGLEAKSFFMRLWTADCENIAVENPIPSKVYDMPPYSQTIQPYEYGEPYSKKTCLWLKGLPKLIPTNILTEYKPFVSCGTSHNKGNPDKAGVSRSGGAAKVRSKTFPGIAKAIAEQWSAYLEGLDDETKP